MKGKGKQTIGVIEKTYYGINQKVEEFISEELVKINLILTICINCDWIELRSKSYSWAEAAKVRANKNPRQIYFFMSSDSMIFYLQMKK